MAIWTKHVLKSECRILFGVGCLLVLCNGIGRAQGVEGRLDNQETMRLQGLRVAIIIAEGYHEHEFWFPYYRFREEGADVTVAGPTKGVVLGEGRHGKDGLPATVKHTVKEIAEEVFDLIYLPGGLWSPMRLRAHRPTLELIRNAMDDGTIVAAICHAPWILVSADVVRGRKIACPGDMTADVTNAGGIFVREPAVRDGNLITAVYFGNLPDHFRLLIPALLERRRGEPQAESPTGPGADSTSIGGHHVPTANAS